MLNEGICTLKVYARKGFLGSGGGFAAHRHAPSAPPRFIEAEVRRVEMTHHQVLLPVSAGSELLCAALHQALILKRKQHHPTLTPGSGTTRHTAQGRTPVMTALGSGRAVTHHVLPLGQNLEEGVMPLEDVGVQQVAGRESPLAEGADVSVQSVVVVLVVLQGVEHLAAAGHLTGELGHPGGGTPGGDAIPRRTERQAPCHHSPSGSLSPLPFKWTDKASDFLLQVQILLS